MLNFRDLMRLSLIVCLISATVSAWARTPVGSTAPDFVLSDMHKNSVDLDQLKGKPVVLFFFCGCRLCHATARAWVASLRKYPMISSRAKTVVVFAGDKREAQAFESQTGLRDSNSLLLLDPTANISTMIYDADPCPCVFVLSSDQKILYSNDHANLPEKVTVANVLVRDVDHVLAYLPVTATRAGSPPTPHAVASEIEPQLDPLPVEGTKITVDQGFKAAIYNFGSVDQKTVKSVEHVFDLKNDSTTDISISGVQPSCGCTTAYINGSNTFPIDVKPGETIHVTASVDLTSLYPEDISKSVYIFGKTDSDALAYLEIDGEIRDGT